MKGTIPLPIPGVIPQTGEKMKKIALAVITVAVAMATLVAPNPAASAAPWGSLSATAMSGPSSPAPAARKSKVKCARSTEPRKPGACYKFLSSRFVTKPVDTVPLQNKSYKKKGTFTCSFSKTVTRSAEYGASITSSAEVNAVFGLAKLSLSATVHKSVTQTSSQATAAGVSVVLKPREKVFCLQTYGKVVMRTRKIVRTAEGAVTKSVHKVSIPSTMGVALRD